MMDQAAAGKAGAVAGVRSAFSDWQVSTQTGDFTWFYPMEMPAAASDDAPEVSLGYTSGATALPAASVQPVPRQLSASRPVVRRSRGCSSPRSRCS